jgi:hypothetical protein
MTFVDATSMSFKLNTYKTKFNDFLKSVLAFFPGKSAPEVTTVFNPGLSHL